MSRLIYFFQKSIFGRILSSKFDFWVNFEIKIDLWVDFSAQKSIFELKIDSQINFWAFLIFQEKRRLERGPTPEEECGRPDELDRWDIKKKKIEHLEAVDVIF